MVVYTNEERNAHNQMLARQMAKRNQVPLIAWRKTLAGTMATDLSHLELGSLYEHFPETTTYFIAGAPGILQDNLNVDLGLANGTPRTYHSIILNQLSSTQDQASIRNAQPGEVVFIQEPQAINVSLSNVNINSWPDNGSLSSAEVLIPIVISGNNSLEIGKRNKVRFKTFGVELAFALTFHKVQGQTLNRVILDLNHRPGSGKNIDFAALFVGLSRVRKSDHIRLIPFRGKTEGFLKKLTPKSYLGEWEKMYCPESKDSLFMIIK
jgi:hypothetical protein